MLGKASVSEIVNALPEKKSRPWISRQLKKMVVEEKLRSAPEGRFVYYVLPYRADLLSQRVAKNFTNKDINEDIIFDELASSAPFMSEISEDVRNILHYAFSEMLNNAIEHSKSESIEVFIECFENKVVFEVQDKGIGVYKNIEAKKRLKSELESIQELMKGKTTTMPHSHSGEGIFFTSKIADTFILDSFTYRLRIDNQISDIFVENLGSNGPKGTRVRFELSQNTEKHLSDIFREFQAEPGSLSFDKTKVQVKLFLAGTVYISRSQARRLMTGLDKYKVIVLDFKGITTVGQAFADEVFRVFQARNPKISIVPVNMSETVEFMISRAKNSN